MSTYLHRTGGISQNANAPVLDPSAVEAAAWEYFAPHASLRTAVWVDCSSVRHYKAAGSGDPASEFRLVNRAGGNVLIAEPVRNRHPFIVTDDITGRPAMVFGAGGAGGNVLAQPATGTLVFRAKTDASGREVGNVSMIYPNQGWTALAKVRLPVFSTTVDGVAFGTDVGGALMGAAAASESNAWEIECPPEVGRMRAFNRHGSTASDEWIENSVSLRDSAWHTVVATFDAGLARYSMWIDGAAVTPKTAVPVDISTASGCDKLMIGGAGLTGSGATRRFIGIASFFGYLPSPIGDLAAARTAFLNLMATK